MPKRMCICGRPIETAGNFSCDFHTMMESADEEARRVVEVAMYGSDQPTEADYEEAHRINAAIDAVQPVQSAQREPIRQPQRKHGPNRRRGW